MNLLLNARACLVDVDAAVVRVSVAGDRAGIGLFCERVARRRCQPIRIRIGQRRDTARGWVCVPMVEVVTGCGVIGRGAEAILAIRVEAGLSEPAETAADDRVGMPSICEAKARLKVEVSRVIERAWRTMNAGIADGTCCYKAGGVRPISLQQVHADVRR